MPDHSHKFAPPPILFNLCGHTTPPSPRPALPPTSATPTTPKHYPHRCLPCDISTRLASQSLFLDAYNGLIGDQAARLRIAAARRNTVNQGRYDNEMVEEGERRIREWRMRRAEEVSAVWAGFLERWNTPAGGGMGEGRTWELKLRVDGEGGYGVEGVPEGGVVE